MTVTRHCALLKQRKVNIYKYIIYIIYTQLDEISYRKFKFLSARGTNAKSKAEYKKFLLVTSLRAA